LAKFYIIIDFVKIYSDQDSFPTIDYPVVTMGTFDGVHMGHQKILKKLLEIARDNNGEAVVVTFEPHPRIVLQLDHENLKFLNSFEEKKTLFQRFGIDHLIVITFTTDFSKLSYEDFIKSIIVNKLHTKDLVIGYDHHFGKDRQGDFNHLSALGKKFDFNVKQVTARSFNDDAISSTKIRIALAKGDIKIANKYLGYSYTLSGKVVGGYKIGRKLGFPTANILVKETSKIIPANGVYAVYVEINNRTYKGMLSVGARPTFNEYSENIEVHIFDFDEDIYGKEITLLFSHRIRNIEKYENADALREQLFKDMVTAKKLLS
jgi:riboflavin kinase/FMN adenylyltransferase